jgi:methyl-accepting chemotaxis protein
MLSAKHPESFLNPAEDLTDLLSAVEAVTRDTGLLALNMALEGASAGAAGTAQLADAVGELSIRATQFSQRMRGRLLAGGDELDPGSLSELRRVTRGVAELIAGVSDLASDVLEGITDPTVERRLPEVASDLLDQLRNRARALDHLVNALPDVAPGKSELAQEADYD